MGNICGEHAVHVIEGGLFHFYQYKYGNHIS